ncbi:MAG: hypothetical protein MAG715_01074 [Methanonatronarchaeales archaeon]|nr:hypothetical protein [Methanonatronarchaeales archaeon]
MVGPGTQETGEIAERFILASVAWLAFGSVLAIYFTLKPVIGLGGPIGVGGPLKFAHAHSLLIGFVGMMIFGVAYRMLPLPPLLATGGLYSVDLARYHFYLANGALIGLVAAAVALTAAFDSTVWRYALALFGLLEAAAMFLFVYNIYRTVGLRSAELPFGGPGGPGPR